MGLPPKLLGADEYEVIHTRTHAKALVGPALVLIVLGAAVGAGVALVPTEFRPVGQVAVAALGAIPLWFWVVLPFLRWRTTTYTITNRRLITRSGILNKIGKDRFEIVPHVSSMQLAFARVKESCSLTKDPRSPSTRMIRERSRRFHRSAPIWAAM